MSELKSSPPGYEMNQAAPQPVQAAPQPVYMAPQPTGTYVNPQLVQMPLQGQVYPQQMVQQPQQMGQQPQQMMQQPQQMMQQPGQLQFAPGQQPVVVYPPQQAGQRYVNATPIAVLGRGSAPVDCPVCGQREMTRVTYEVGNTTHGWAFMACIFFCLGCIPYLMNDLKDVSHHCARCGALLATWHRSGSTQVHQHG